MKEIALMGTNSHVFANVLTALLHRDMSVYAMTEAPEKVMLDDTRLTVGLYDYADEERMAEALEGYSTVVLVYDDNLADAKADDVALHYFGHTVNAAARAGAKRVIVVASPESEAFFTGNLKRRADLDWVFISTENDYPDRVASEVVNPSYHKEVYTA